MSIVSPIGVGVIGASPGASWSAISHVPAIQSLPEYQLRAVSTSRRSSADAAALEFGTVGFDDPLALIADPAVDLVVVAVKVPSHHALIAAALKAGKMVYCEWPLGTSLAEAEDLARLAKGSRTAIGLQARYSPSLRYIRDLIAAGELGDIVATNFSGSAFSWGDTATNSSAYLFDPNNGATPLSVVGMHALDGLRFALGEFESVAAHVAVSRPTVRNVDTGLDLDTTTPDQISISGRLHSGAIVSAFIRGGVSIADATRWEINGTKGHLVLTSDTNLQVVDATISGALSGEAEAREIMVPSSYTGDLVDVPAGPARNVAAVYRALAHDIKDDTHTVSDFEHAVGTHRLLDAITRAAASGRTVSV